MALNDLDTLPTARVSRKAARELTNPGLSTRVLWAAEHSARIADMLDSKAKKNTPGRIWRMRFFQDDDYLVATLVQNINPPTAPGQQAPKVITYISRGYHRTNGGGGSVVQQALFGEYSTDEIVAFLRLDLVDPDTADWRDETKYSDVIVVRDVIKNLQGTH